MPEEVRFFVRIAIFTVAIATIYWFVSYEEAGTMLLAGIIAGAVVFTGIVVTVVRAARPRSGAPKQLLGFDETGAERPLGLTEDVFPAMSAWPLILSVGACLVGVGLIYGAWLWIPGVALALSAAWGWLTEA